MRRYSDRQYCYGMLVTPRCLQPQASSHWPLATILATSTAANRTKTGTTGAKTATKNNSGAGRNRAGATFYASGAAVDPLATSHWPLATILATSTAANRTKTGTTGCHCKFLFFSS